MVRPLGLPVGSVRALLLLALTTRAVFDLRHVHEITPWMLVALALAAASYFAARAGGEEGARPRHAPLFLPAGTIRLLFLALAGYGAWVWFQHHDTPLGAAPVFWVLAGFALGLVVRLVNRRRKGGLEAGATYFEHMLALVTLIAAGGLVWLGLEPPTDLRPWIEPLLGAIVVHYFATR